MSLNIKPFILGPIHNNTYLVFDSESRQAVVIDPSYNIEKVIREMIALDLSLAAIWITHGHFDHFAGASQISRSVSPSAQIGLHPDDIPMLRNGGGAYNFGFEIENDFTPEIHFTHGQVLKIGGHAFEVRHTPGHSPGHVVFYGRDDGVAFCGDLIFNRGIGRADLEGGDYAALVNSIRTSIFSLPPSTRLLCGHGPDTTVGEEMEENPFL